MSEPVKIGEVVDLDRLRQRPATSGSSWEVQTSEPEARVGPPPAVPARYAIPLDELETTAAVERVKGWLSDRPEGGGLMLSGLVGRGKSTLAGAVASHFGAPFRASYWPVVDLVSAMQREISQPPEGKPVRVKVDERPVLVLDDIGTEAGTPWQAKALADIVAYRYDQRLTLVATTNLSPKLLGERLGERTLSRLTEMCELVVVDGPDRRRTA